MTYPPQGGRPAEQPPYGQPPQGQPPYGQPPYGPPPYGQPPQGQPPYGPPPYGAPAPRSRRGLTIGLVLGAIVLLLCCGGLAVGAFGLYKLGTSPEAAATEWLDGVQKRNFTAAYALLCTAERDRMTPAEFRRAFDGDNALDDYELGGLGTTADDRSEVRVRVTLADGRGARDGAVVLVRESGGWKVCDVVGFG